MDTREVIERFNEAFNRHDVDAVMALMTDDVVLENTVPPPDGERVVGQGAVRATWEALFTSNPGAWFDTEELVVAGDRAVAPWRFTFDKRDPNSGHVRGVDVFRVSDGKVAEKLSYVKG